MASRNPIINALYPASFYLWFPLFRFMTRTLPLPFLYATARRTVGTFFDLRPKYLRAIRSNYSRILGKPENSPEVHAAAREMVDIHSYHWIDFFYFGERRAPEAQKLVAGIDGFHKIVAAKEAGKGVILGTAHLGNWYIGGALLSQQGYKVHIVYKPDRFPIVEKYRHQLHQRWGVEEIAVGSSFLSVVPVARALAGGEIVAMQCDRDFNNTGVAAGFFGAPAWFPRGPFLTARATGATFLPSFILRTEDGRYRVVVEDPLPLARSGSPAEDLQAGVEAFVKILERYVRNHPTQWYCFYPFWDDPSRRNPSAGKLQGESHAGLRAEIAPTKNDGK